MDRASHLADLHDAALRRDWNSCRAAVSSMLATLDPSTILRLTRAEVGKRLHAFARQQPGETWPHRILAGLEASSDIAPDLLPVVEYSGPGGNNFRNAMEALLAAHGPQLDPATRATCATHAIAEAIMTGMVEQWGNLHREQWDRWYQAALSGTVLPVSGALQEMMSDPDVAGLERESWMAVASALEQIA